MRADKVEGMIVTPLKVELETFYHTLRRKKCCHDGGLHMCVAHI